MANSVPIKPVISTVSGITAQPEGEMDALLLGRTRDLLNVRKLVNTLREAAENQANGKEEQDVFITEIVENTGKRKITQCAEPATKKLRLWINSKPASNINRDSKLN
ncbi:unnamed protein product [Acanthoscelides obtectus]|uniref:Uncharacterized protein n=1 Tax=Acanthoscelides obtectus TaxID=200917 RepID=A0A9P0L052_ACAOB|nr:unnamed protein product [Acanthoscelides obtectus]CAK1677886.1 hypothetical protein AOBTE_LOCUS31618 [Acanthoscelides obtectus]